MILSYEYMKPSAPDIHQALAGWVRAGGTLVYVGDGSDSFHWVREWWNQGGNTYRTPAEHLMEALGLSRTPEDGLYSVGEGRVQIIGKHPTVLARDADLSDTYLACVCTLLTEGEPSAALILRRGAYYVTAVMDETPASYPSLFREVMWSILPGSQKNTRTPLTNRNFSCKIIQSKQIGNL